MARAFSHFWYGNYLFLCLMAFCVTLCAETALSPPSTAAEPEPVYKINSVDGFALEPRIGSILWQGQSFPTTPSAEVPNTNGIRGNFLFNGPNIPTIGFGTRIHIDNLIRFSPSVDFVFDEYVYRADLGRAFPTQNMTGVAVGPVALVMGVMVNIPLWLDIPLSKRLLLGFAPGLVIYPKLALSPIDGSTGIEAISEYLNKDARWLYPETAFSLRYAIAPWLNAGIEIQVLYPLWHIWSSETMPFYDSMIIKSAIALDFYL